MLDVQSLPNPVDSILAFLEETWPELLGRPNVWLTGGQVWRRLLNQPLDGIKDTDFFCTTKGAHAKMERLLEKLSDWEDDVPSPPSMGPLGGEVWFTKRGRVDLWTVQNPNEALRAYSDIKQHARCAFSPMSKRLIWLPSKVERKKGERYIHYEVKRERSKVDNVMEETTILEWREWPGE